MKTYILVLFFLGIIMTIIGHYQAKQIPEGKIVYKFVDQTIEEAQKGEQESVFNKYISMFTDPPLLI